MQKDCGHNRAIVALLNKAGENSAGLRPVGGQPVAQALLHQRVGRATICPEGAVVNSQGCEPLVAKPHSNQAPKGRSSCYLHPYTICVRCVCLCLARYVLIFPRRGRSPFQAFRLRCLAFSRG